CSRRRQTTEPAARFLRARSAPGLQSPLHRARRVLLSADARVSIHAAAELVVRRRVVHWTCGGIALAFAALATHQGLRLREAERINSAIASARVSEYDASIPQARFARAAALARAGDSEAAIKAYKSLIT